MIVIPRFSGDPRLPWGAPFSRPAEPPHDRATHDPVLVLLRQKRQFLSEVGDALLVSKLGKAVDAGGEVGAPETAARAESVKHALNVIGQVAKRVGLRRLVRYGRHLDLHIRVFRKLDYLSDGFRGLALLGRFIGQVHVVDDEDEVWIALDNTQEVAGAACSRRHHGDARLGGSRPEPVGSAVREPTGLQT